MSEKILRLHEKVSKEHHFNSYLDRKLDSRTNLLGVNFSSAAFYIYDFAHLCLSFFICEKVGKCLPLRAVVKK